VQRPPAAQRVALHVADQDRQRLVGEGRDSLELHEVAVDDVISLQQVARRVADGGELRKHDQLRAGRTRAVHRLTHRVQVAVEGGGRVVELGDGDAHRELLSRPSVYRLHAAYDRLPGQHASERCREHRHCRTRHVLYSIHGSLMAQRMPNLSK